MTLRDLYKSAKRNARYLLLNGVYKAISAQPVDSIPRMHKFLMKVVPMFFQKELKRAQELLPPEFGPAGKRILKKMARNQVWNILEVFLYEKLIEAYPDFISIEGGEFLEDAVKKGRGIIILSGHFGNWELIGYTLARMNLPLHVIARPQAVNRMTEFMNSFRNERGVKVLMDHNLSSSLKLLKEGAVVGIVSDLNAREWGYRVKFFGRHASFYPTPVILSMRSGAPLIPTFIERLSYRRQVVRFEKPLEWAPGETMGERVQKYVHRYEAAFRKRPDQWVWFHERYIHADLGRAPEPFSPGTQRES